ncbi:MAG: pilus assembly protein HicB [Prevotella sp.]|jgi:hypothetical protein|nr:pilus assembly protein HicB [Prevotella sp.]MCH4182053.1 pilus assembly protein HicB [Prevotella sp.]MCH4212363.1 pilus assembly protein HicB [Prevotella sp.]MCH4241468.1 pilus assembly protein HicB [Prevotella sp.]
MKKVRVTVEKASDGNFWCRTEEEINDTFLTSEGATVEEAKKDLLDCYEEARLDAEEEGKEFKKVEFEYKYDLQSFFNYFSFLNINEIARRAGVNPSLMRQYKGGFKNAGEKTYERLSKCINDIKRELQAAYF